MRARPLPASVLALLAFALLLPTATAQEDGCTQARPCTWVVDIDADGLSADEATLNGTLGDWFRFDFFNFDDETHVVSLEGYDLEWTVAPDPQGLETAPFRLHETGGFPLVADHGGRSLSVQVFEEDVVDVEQGPGDGSTTGADDGQSKGIPATGPLLSLGLLATAAVASRRFQ